MDDNPLRRRATVLEDAFFHQVDQQLIVELRRKTEHEAERRDLQQMTGISDERILEELLSAEITPASLMVLSLFPAVHTAWADGHVEAEERTVLKDAAERLSIEEDSPAGQLLDSWVRHRPPERLFELWTEFVCAMRQTVSESAFRDLQKAALERAQAVAEAAGGFLGFHKVSAVEQTAIEQLTAVFEQPTPAGDD